jgi:hypothetical protein
MGVPSRVKHKGVYVGWMRRVPSVGFMASNLLQHWMHLEPAPPPPSFPAAAKQPVGLAGAQLALPAVKIQFARAAPQQPLPQQIPHSPKQSANSQRSSPAPPTPKAEPGARSFSFDYKILALLSCCLRRETHRGPT